jgi:glycopeptide antibiotics resistance protein
VRLALLAWTTAWVWVATPWRSFRLSPSLERVELIPFLDGSPRAQILNLLAFVPLGVIGVRLGWSPRTVALVGTGVSALTELLQLFSSRRHPSITDLILNTAGVLIGILIASGWSNAATINPNEQRAEP